MFDNEVLGKNGTVRQDITRSTADTKTRKAGGRIPIPRKRWLKVNQLIAYLMENLILDFQGALDLDMVRDFFRDDESREAKMLYSKLVEDGGVSDLMLVLADCLKDHIKSGIDEKVVFEQIKTYSES